MAEALWRNRWAAHNWGPFTNDGWLASFGITFVIVNILWSSLNPRIFAPDDLLMALYFLRCYVPDAAAAAHFGVSVYVYRNRVWRVIRALNASMNEINLASRFHDMCPGRVWISVDSTFCPIDVSTQRWAYQALWYNGYKKVHCLKYEVGVHAWTGEILWVRGPYAGPEADVDMLGLGGLLALLLPGEFLYTDKAYTGHPRCLPPFKGRTWNLTYAEWAWNQWINHIRVRVENSISRIVYKFRCLSHFWRHDIHAHAEAFLCAAQIAALDIKHHPIRTDFYEVFPRPPLLRP